MAAEKFIADFHALSGTTIGEIKKSLNHLLITNATLDAATLHTITQNLQPITYMERLLKLEFLIFFKRSEELLQLFKGSNDAILTKILKQDWFFLEQFSNVSAVQDILLDLGFRTRMKFLNRLSKLLSFFDDIFDMILTRYGVGVAREFTFGCSSAKVREVVTNFKLCFNWKDLMRLYKKDKSLVGFYFEMYTKKFNRKPEQKTYWRLLRAVAVDDFKEYLALTKYFSEQDLKGFRLGSRLTAKITRSFRSSGSENHVEHLLPKIYWRKSSVESRKRVLREVKVKLQNHCLGLNELMNLLKVFPSKRRYEIWVEVLGEPSEDWVFPETLRLVPNVQERARLARIKLETIEVGNATTYIKFLEIDEAILKYKELMNSATDFSSRILLLSEMIEACAMSRSLPALKNVIGYFWEHHRDVGISFPAKVEQCFALSTFDTELWSIYEQISLRPSIDAYLACIAYKCKNCFDINEIVKEFWAAYPNTCKLSACGEAKTKFIEASLALHDLNVAQQITKWILEEDGVKSLIYTYPRLVSTFKHMLDKPGMSHLRKYIFKLVFDPEFEDRQAYFDIYFNHYGEYRGINWFLNNEPANLSFERLIFWTIEANPYRESKTAWKTWHLVKQYNDLSSQVLDHCRESIPKVEGYQIARTVSTFSMLASFEQFTEFLNTVPPTGDTPLIYNPDEDVGRAYILRCEFGRCLQYFELSYASVRTLFNFCRGDYWQTTLEALINIAFRLPEKHLEAGFVTYLKAEAVSVRKHALYLSLQLSDITSARQELAWFMANEKNITIQKRIFESFGKFLRKNPYDDIFLTLLESLLMIRKEDEESLKLITKIEKIPEDYRSRYFLAAWDHLKLILPESEKLYAMQKALLHRSLWVDKDLITALPLKFIVDLTKEYFLKDKISKNVINKFLFHAVLNGHETILDEMFNAIKISKDYSFFELTYPKVMRDLPDRHILENYIQGCDQIFTDSDNFRESAKVVFLKFKLEHLEASIEDWSRAYLEFFDKSFEKFGDFILKPLANVIGDITGYFIAYPFKESAFLVYLLKAKPGDVRVAMVVVKRISAMGYWSIDRHDMIRIVELLKLIEDRSVMINFKLYCNNVIKQHSLTL